MESFSQKSKEIENFFKAELIPISLSMEKIFYFGPEGAQMLNDLTKIQESIDSGLFSSLTFDLFYLPANRNPGRKALVSSSSKLKKQKLNFAIILILGMKTKIELSFVIILLWALSPPS